MYEVIAKVLICAFFPCIFLSSCSLNETQKYNTLYIADDIIESQPDSALQLLMAEKNLLLSGNEKSKALYGLLLTQAKYRLYQENADSLLPIIAACEEYFGNSADKGYYCRSMYYHGMLLFKVGRLEEATFRLKKGLDIAVEILDTLQIAKYYESLCMINDTGRCDSILLGYARKFYDISVVMSEKERIARSINNLATAYWRLDMKDSATICRRKALPLLDSITDLNRAYLMTNIGSDYIYQKDYVAAKDILHKAINITPLANAYKMLGDINEIEGHTEQALNMWQKAFSTGTPRVRCTTLRAFIDAAIGKADYKTATYFYEEYLRLSDSIQSTSEKKKLAEIQAKYDREVLKNIMNKRILLLQLVILAAILLVIIIWNTYRKREKKFVNALEKYELVIKQKGEELRSLQVSLENEMSLHHELSVDFKIQEEKMAILRDEIALLQKASMTRLGRGKEIFTSICNNGRMPNIDADDEHCFIEFYSFYHHAEYEKWMSTYENLTPRLITYLILDDMGISDKQKEYVLSVGRAAIGMTKTRLNKSRKG